MLIPFHSPDASDSTWVRPLLQSEGLALCDYSFPFSSAGKTPTAFSTPPGETAAGPAHQLPGPFLSLARREGDSTLALDALTQDARAEGQPLRLIALTLYHKNWLEDHYPGRFCFEEARDGFDHLYSVDRLADLPGKKLHAKRNHIHRLDEACPGWTWAPLTQADIPACLAMDAAWHQDALTRETVRGLSTLDDEHRALVLALEHLPALGLEGIVLRWQDTL
ncbi:MAG: phosphatidylglycerol lysyltransferase domain-containing protein [Evtepia gabavorous]